MSDEPTLAACHARHRREDRSSGNPEHWYCSCGKRWLNCDAAVLGDEWVKERHARQAAEAERDKYVALWNEQGIVSRGYRERAEAAEARSAALAGALGAAAAWLLSYSWESEIACRWPGIYQNMLWHGYRAACAVLGRKPVEYAAWRGWFTDTVRQTYFDDLLARHSDDARQALAGEP